MLWSCGFILTSQQHIQYVVMMLVEGEGWCFAKKNMIGIDLEVIELAKQLELYENPIDLKTLLDNHDEKIQGEI